MAKVTLRAIKDWFRTGLRPTQKQFWDVWDSFWHKDDKIPLAQIEEIENILNNKADTTALQGHLFDPQAHTELFAKKVDKRKDYDLSKNDFTDELKTKLQNLEYSNFKGQFENLEDLKKACPEGKPLGKEQGYYAFVQVEQITLFIWDNKKYVWVEQKQLSNLQEITDKGNVTSNAIQIIGSGKIDQSKKSIFTYYSDGIGCIGILNPSAALTDEKLIIGNSGKGSSNAIVLANQTEKQSAVTITSNPVDLQSKDNYQRIQAADALNPNDLTTLKQVKALIPNNIQAGLVLGETSVTACRGDIGKSAYDHSLSKGNPHNTKMADIEGLQVKFEKIDKLGEYITKEDTSSASFLNIGSKDNSIIKLIRNNSSVFVVNDAGMIIQTDLNIYKAIKGGSYEITFDKGSDSSLVFNRVSSMGEIAQFQIKGNVKAGVQASGCVYGSDATRENEFTTLSQVKAIIKDALNEKIKELEKK